MGQGVVAETIKVTTTGSAGSATGSGRSQLPIRGELLGLYVNYTGAPGTTDVTVKTAGLAGPSYNLLVITNGNTDGFFAPRAKPVDNANAAITNAHAPFPLADYVDVDVAQGDAGTDLVAVTLLIRK